MKVCKSCLVSKELNEFYIHSKMSDGHINVCKSCKRKYQKQRQELGFTTEIEKRRNRKRQNLLTERAFQWRKNNPEKYKAHNTLNNSLRDGKIIKPNECSDCGKVKKLHAHHRDYSKPLDVEWLCVKCHGKRNPKFIPF